MAGQRLPRPVRVWRGGTTNDTTGSYARTLRRAWTHWAAGRRYRNDTTGSKFFATARIPGANTGESFKRVWKPTGARAPRGLHTTFERAISFVDLF